MLPVGEMHLNIIKDYVKPLGRMRYGIEQLHDESKRFVWVEMKLGICAAQVDHPVLNIKFTS